jgi:protein gp37
MLPDPLPGNVWLGVTAGLQRRAVERLPLLLAQPATARFVSCEPLLGPLELTAWLATGGLHWVIAGAESGRGARPMLADWVRSLREQCARAGVAFFFKQEVVNGRKVSLPLLDGARHADTPCPTAPGMRKGKSP